MFKKASQIKDKYLANNGKKIMKEVNSVQGINQQVSSRAWSVFFQKQCHPLFETHDSIMERMLGVYGEIMVCENKDSKTWFLSLKGSSLEMLNIKVSLSLTLKE